MRRKTFVFATAILGVVGAAADETSVILRQAGSPLTITSYRASFAEGYSGSRSLAGTQDQIAHAAGYTNVSGKTVVALQLGLTTFDAFNGFMNRFSAWDISRIPSGSSKTGQWNDKPYAAFSFKGYGTGVAYVNAVRFEDGSIWRANISEVLLELQKFEKELKQEDLVEKKK